MGGGKGKGKARQAQKGKGKARRAKREKGKGRHPLLQSNSTRQPERNETISQLDTPPSLRYSMKPTEAGHEVRERAAEMGGSP